MSILHIRQVQPGEVITAADWNRVAQVLADLDARLEILEASSSGGPVVITQLVYTPPLRMGQALEIQGRNFGVSRGAQSVQFDRNFIIRYGEGSTDSRLLVTVPTDLPEIDEEGRDVVVRVSNGASSDTRTIRIYPMDVPVSGNIVDITWLSVEPETLEPGSPAMLNFKANSRAGNPVTFDVTITISDPTLQAGQRLFTGTREVPDFRLRLIPLVDLPFTISLPAIPASLADEQFRVFILFRSGAMVGSLTRDFPVGESIEPPDTIGLNPDRFIVLDPFGFPDHDAGAYDAATNTILLRAGRAGTMTMATTFEDQDTYEYCVNIIEGSGWSAAIGTDDCASIEIDAGDFAAGSPAVKNLAFGLSAIDSAATSGEIVFTVQREGHSPATFRMNLAIKP